MSGVDVRMLGRARVLIVEDEFLIAEELRQIVAAADGEVVGPVASLEDGLARLAGEAIDAAILDINLRDGAVYPLAEELERLGRPFVFATGFDHTTIPPRFAGARRFEKPYQPSEIMRAVHGLLAAKR